GGGGTPRARHAVEDGGGEGGEEEAEAGRVGGGEAHLQRDAHGEEEENLDAGDGGHPEREARAGGGGARAVAPPHDEGEQPRPEEELRDDLGHEEAAVEELGRVEEQERGREGRGQRATALGDEEEECP